LKKGGRLYATHPTDSCRADEAVTPPVRLAAVGKRLDTMLQAVKLVRSSLDDFYATLSDEQKAQFKRSVRGEQPRRISPTPADTAVAGKFSAKLGFGGVEPEATGRSAYHPATLLKIYVYGYLNRVQSSRRLERECQRNIELVWLTGRLMPDFRTIADFRKDNGAAIREVCREFVVLCRRLELFSEASVAIDGSKFKAVNTRDRNFTQGKMQRRLAQIDESIARYLSQLDSANHRSPGRSRTGGQDHPAQREDCNAAPGDTAPERSEHSDDADRGQADLADRSRCALDGHKWPRQRDGRLQCAKCRRHQASSHCCP